jgi:hypothetical protein
MRREMSTSDHKRSRDLTGQLLPTAPLASAASAMARAPLLQVRTPVCGQKGGSSWLLHPRALSLTVVIFTGSPRPCAPDRVDIRGRITGYSGQCDQGRNRCRGDQGLAWRDLPAGHAGSTPLILFQTQKPRPGPDLRPGTPVQDVSVPSCPMPIGQRRAGAGVPINSLRFAPGLVWARPQSGLSKKPVVVVTTGVTSDPSAAAV